VRFDYQLGGAYAPPAGPRIVTRDRRDPPARGVYNICYINGFQVQADEAVAWLVERPELVLRDDRNVPVVDWTWNEMLIDIRLPGQRQAVADIVGAWIADCAESGYDAVEIDNLDSYTRSGGLISPDDAVAMMRMFAGHAHMHDMAVAQKNAPDLVKRRRDLRTDFAIVEECAAAGECDDFIRFYGSSVYDIEYSPADFETACRSFPQLSIILRDRELSTPDRPGYMFDGC
jgi:hypothetical protein